MAASVDHAALREVALRAASEASALTRAVQSRREALAAATKDDRSPVTVADYAVQALVNHRLRAELGRAPMIAEESAAALAADGARALRSAVLEALAPWWPGVDEAALIDALTTEPPSSPLDGFWTLDPIDGTKGFLRGGHYAIALAWLEVGRPTVGVMACPNLGLAAEADLLAPDPHGSLYAAIAGEGCSATPGDAPQAPPRPVRYRAAGDDVIRVCESVEPGHSRHEDVERVLARVGRRAQSVRMDSQCKYAVVASGRADAYLRMPTRADYRENIWDHAAGALIASEAGAVVSDIHGRDLDFSLGPRLSANRGIVCAGPAVHPLLVAAIAELGIGRDGA